MPVPPFTTHHHALGLPDAHLPTGTGLDSQVDPPIATRLRHTPPHALSLLEDSPISGSLLGPPAILTSPGSENRLGSLAHLVFNRLCLHSLHVTIELRGQRMDWAPLLLYSLRPHLCSPHTTMLWASPTHVTPLGLGWTPMWIRPSPSTSNTLHRTPPHTPSRSQPSMGNPITTVGAGRSGAETWVGH